MNKNKVKTRQASPNDYDAIHDLVAAAFKTGKMPYDHEENYVRDLRKRKTFLPDLELVAELEEKIIGHIMFSKHPIGEHQSLLLSPLCVKLEFRNLSIGEKLVYAGFERASEIGYTSAFLVGYPDYYGKFGFKEIGAFGIVNDSGISDTFVLGCEIREGGLSEVRGSIGMLE